MRKLKSFSMIESLSIQQARKLVLLSQRLPTTKQSGSALSSTLSAFEHLGYVQIDTISAIQRAHHHTLWNRNPRYENSHIDQLLEEKQIFEYWSHAAAYLPMRDYRFSLVRKYAIEKGDQDHWYDRDKALMKSVMIRISNEGPLMSKDFEDKKKMRGEWSYKPTKRALEYLFMQGELMIPKRVSFQKVYDLTERVLPKNINTSMPSPEEYARFLIIRFLQANGLGQAVEIGYLRKDTKAIIFTTLQEMLNNGDVIKINVKGNRYFALGDSLELLGKPLSRNKLKILSPFDNLLIQRKRILALFDYDYQIECYIPEAKRRHGYFSLPILWDGKLLARMDCKADRKNSVLHINHLVLELKLVKIEAFSHALSKELESFMRFNDCSSVFLHKATPRGFEKIIQKSINGLAI